MSRKQHFKDFPENFQDEHSAHSTSLSNDTSCDLGLSSCRLLPCEQTLSSAPWLDSGLLQHLSCGTGALDVQLCDRLTAERPTADEMLIKTGPAIGTLLFSVF